MKGIDNKKIEEVLVKLGYVSKEDIDVVVAGGSSDIALSLIESGLINYDLIGQAFAEDFKVPYYDLNSKLISRENVRKIPEDAGLRERVIFVGEDKKNLSIATDFPLNPDLKKSLASVLKSRKIKVYYSLPQDVSSHLVHYRDSLEQRFKQIIEKGIGVAPEIVGEIIDDAIAFRASDIHFEPDEQIIRLRMRIDGVLKEMAMLDKVVYENVVNRIKVMASLRIDEHSTTQDGAIHFIQDDIVSDLRVSVVPVVYGEKIVLRVLGSYVQDFSLQTLGLTSKHRDMLSRNSKKPFGLILVIGPTGSGKTTTLYALLKMLNKASVNITTIEDPVEYKVSGVNQIQVSQETGLTFAKGLRSIVRQDPDIILVGEIRDKETAEIAINAALTGHLVLSTFHANDAATAIPRLLDMGIEPFLLSSTLELVIGQRLVRSISDECKTSKTLNKNDSENLFEGSSNYFSAGDVVYSADACSAGDQKYKGRTAIFEMIESTPELQDVIYKNPSSKAIWEQALKQGSKPLFDDGIDKVKRGFTDIEELLRVAEPPQIQKTQKKVKKSKTKK